MGQTRILAEKNGYRRHFTEMQWAVLGSDKCGWVLVPKEVFGEKSPVIGTPTAKISEFPPVTITGKPQVEAPANPSKRKPRKK